MYAALGLARSNTRCRQRTLESRDYFLQSLELKVKVIGQGQRWMQKCGSTRVSTAEF